MEPSGYIIEDYKETLPSDWDAFVEQSSTGSIHQLSSWKSFQSCISGREVIWGFGVRDTKTQSLIAGTLCIRMQTGIPGMYWWYSSRGPVFDVHENSEAGRMLIRHVRSELKKTHALYWRMNPGFSPEEYTSLELPAYQNATKQYNPTDTLLIDLDLCEEEILAQMKRKGRYNINLARKKGITIRIIPGDKVSKKDLAVFFELMNETTTRDGFSGHGIDYYDHMLQNLGSHAVLCFAELDGKPLASAITTLEGERAIYYFGASTSDKQFRNLMAPYLLQWEMMLWAKKHKAKTYDFLGIAPEDQADHAYSGITAFKNKFGGYRKTYAPGVEIIFRPFAYTLYRAVRKIRTFFR